MVLLWEIMDLWTLGITLLQALLGFHDGSADGIMLVGNLNIKK